jgi:DUF1365 family protein
MVLEGGFIRAKVHHHRTGPKKHSFNYCVYYLCFPLSKMGQLANAILSLNRFNLLSFYEKDHQPQAENLEAWARGVLKEFRVPEADGEIVFMTMPRVLGYVFNPVSFLFCLDRDGKPRAVIADINNTMGENHAYLLHHEDNRVILNGDELKAKKVFHVSHYLDRGGMYTMRVQYSELSIGVWIRYDDPNVGTLHSSVTGKRQPLSTMNCLKAFITCPLMTLKVLGAIHYQGIKMIIRKFPHFKRPPPPDSKVS